MSVKIKICGLSTSATLAAALAAAADFVGFVCFPRSPRHIEPAAAASLADIARGRAKIVSLTVDASDDLLDALVRAVRPDYLQLHGAESPARVAAIVQRWKVPAIKAIKVASAADAATATAYAGFAEFPLFDAKTDERAPGRLPGGNGIAFDWRAIAGAQRPFMLSGGLDAGNVAEAIVLTGAPMVDVSSGIESAPGTKDIAKINNFIAAARAAKDGMS